MVVCKQGESHEPWMHTTVEPGAGLWLCCAFLGVPCVLVSINACYSCWFVPGVLEKWGNLKVSDQKTPRNPSKKKPSVP